MSALIRRAAGQYSGHPVISRTGCRANDGDERGRILGPSTVASVRRGAGWAEELDVMLAGQACQQLKVWQLIVGWQAAF